MDKCCSKCRHFEARTHFCRYLPPQPVVFTNESGYGNGNERLQNVSSKFPVVTHPEMDYCNFFSGISEGRVIVEG